MEYLNENLMVGKEYYLNGKLKFEGEYLKGKKWNGITYDIEGNFIFEIKNGNVNGKAKEYDIKGNLIFEGEYENGERMESYILIIK